MPLNAERAREAMQSRQVDAIVAASLENVYYVSDYWSLRQEFQCGEQSYAILPLDGEPAIVAPLEEADIIADSGSWIGDISFYGAPNVEVSQPGGASEGASRLIELYRGANPEGDAVSALVKALERVGLARGVLALDTSRMTPRMFDAIRSRLPEAKLVEGADLLRSIRLVKTGEEVARIEKATAVTEKSMEDALEIARPEITELDLAGMFGYSVAYDGGRVTYNLIGFRERSAFPSPLPSEFEARRGDIIRMTFGCTWRHYHSNISRTAILGRPPNEARRRWRAVESAQEAALAVVRPGVRASEIYAAAEGVLKGAGLKRYAAHFGHGIGVECNEAPLIGRGEGGELLEGMVLNIDVYHLDLGWGGFQLEDTVMVTAGGPRLLTKTDRDLYVL